MTRVAVEFPIEEAEGIVKRLRDESMSVADCHCAMGGCRRLEQAIAVERGAGGSAERPPTVRERAEALLGQIVRVRTSYGDRFGQLDGVIDHGAVIVEQGPLRLRRTIPLSAVISIEAARERAAA